MCKEIMSEEIPVNSSVHVNIIKDNAVAPTCTKTGLTEGSHCTACNSVVNEQKTIAKLGHNYTSKTMTDKYLKTAATCTSPAVYYYKCTRCTSKSGTYTVGTTSGHSYAVTWLWKTDRSSATATFTCSVCGKTGKVTASVTNGKLTSSTVKAACTKDGKITYTAKVTYGGKTYTSTKTKTLTKTGHSYASPTWIWNDYTSAKATFKCSVCGYSVTKTGTITSKTTKAATCAAKGTKTYTATVTFKDTVYKSTKTKSLAVKAHTPASSWTVTEKATTTASGTKIKKCTVCSATVSTSTISKISSVKLSKTEYEYTGSNVTDSVVIKDSKGNTLKNGTDYSLSYPGGRKEPGSRTVKVTFKGQYSGTKTLSFKIVIAKVTGVKTSKSGTISYIAWDNVSGASGYEIEVFNNKTGKWAHAYYTAFNKLQINNAPSNIAFHIKAYVDSGDKQIFGPASEKFFIQ